MFKSPQVFFRVNVKSIETTSKFQNFYVRLNVMHGVEWQSSNPRNSFDTFVVESSSDSSIHFDFQFELNYVIKDIRGWPRLVVEIFGYDKDRSKSSCIGYGTSILPLEAKTHNIDIPLVSPIVPGTSYPSLQKLDLLVLSQNRFGMEMKSVGCLSLEISTSTKDFDVNGIEAS